MPEWIKVILWILLIPVGLIILYLAGVILLGMITFYNPQETEPLAISRPCDDHGQPGDTMGIITWNLGYGGLGREMDFFYEEGEKVRPERTLYNRYINGIMDMIGQHDDVDFFLFQETDLRAKRSYYDNQIERIRKQLPDFKLLFSLNYDVRFVPLPFARPMGRVKSGILIAGRTCADTALRYAFPPDEAWPTRLFMLQRCFLRSQFTIGNGQLAVINIHNSAYDETGETKSIQLEMVRKEIVNAYKNGDFVITGGDWNQNPPDFNQEQIISGDKVKTITPLIPGELMPVGWKWVYDPSLPTNRDVNEPYSKGRTPTTIIDYFLVSPNVEVLEVRTIPTSFEFTDHQPVYMKVRLIR